MAEQEVQLEIRVPKGVQLSQEEIDKITADFQGEQVDTVAAERALAAAKDVAVVKVEEVRPKAKVVGKVTSLT
jgi:hypothetical protein